MERGFIQGKLEIKFLLLYILARAEQPLDLDSLFDVAMCDKGVSYFDFTSALAELVETDHVTLEDKTYTITEKGRKNGSATEDQLPYSVCLHCDQKLSEINERMHAARRVRSTLTQQENGSWLIQLELDNDQDNNLFSLSLSAPLQEDAQQLIQRFQANPQGFYQTLLQI